MSAARKGGDSKGPEGGPPKSFEEALERLEAIVEELEGGEPPLEKAVGLYEEGVGLFRFCRQQLDAAQKRIEELAGETEDALSLQAFEEDEEEDEEDDES
ncbi:MAG: exodeoxyribonuclease VII small subunit [Candidatus Tectomicrobia bacterium]|uniref:Exodeoxyribonuclease 7 small subunit n=1 Tax=Tectimicrobiota bacterium TaxID=2528274 RepID=A0A932MP02_UNCTE|nr:exodeoxyribonuclease VII small subunit [Candidatus Tectomicrobia bacterium]